LFRIDRSQVNVGAVRSFNFNAEGTEAGAAGESPDAAVSSAAAMEEIQQQAKEQEQENEQTRLQAQEKARGILSEAEDQAKAAAAKMLEEAREEIAQLMSSAREEAEEERRKAWQEGFESGSEEGKRSYDQQLEEKIREDDEKLKQVISELYEEREKTYSGLEDEVIKLAMGIVRKVINPPEEELCSFFEPLVRNALKQMSPDGRIMIRVGPAEYERFFSSGSTALELESGLPVTVSVLRDVSLGAGDCVIDSENSTVNAGFDTQMRYIQLAFDKAVVEN